MSVSANQRGSGSPSSGSTTPPRCALQPLHLNGVAPRPTMRTSSHLVLYHSSSPRSTSSSADANVASGSGPEKCWYAGECPASADRRLTLLTPLPPQSEKH